MTRLGRRNRRRGSARHGGSFVSASDRFHRCRLHGWSKTMGACVHRIAHAWIAPERFVQRLPKTSAVSSEATSRSAPGERPQGRTPPLKKARVEARAGDETPKRDQSGGRPPPDMCATRLTCAEGDQNLRRGAGSGRSWRVRAKARDRSRNADQAGRNGSARSAQIGRLIRRDWAVAGEDAEAQAGSCGGAAGRNARVMRSSKAASRENVGPSQQGRRTEPGEQQASRTPAQSARASDRSGGNAGTIA